MAFTLKALPEHHAPTSDHLAKAAGFSPHADVAAEPFERYERERLARYITRPALAESRLSLTTNGLVRYALPYRDGTTHLCFEPIDFIARLAALIPKPSTSHATTASLHPTAAIVPQRLPKPPS